MFNNKSILVTGGTGSFGKKFILNILNNYNPKKVIIYSRDELKQSQMMEELQDKTKNFKSLRFFLGDVRDYDRLYLALQDVDYVVHAAALKQVPAAEYNPTEFIQTNIHGAENIIKAALRTNVKKVIALSTDKAVNPINLYGGTKLVSDKLFVSANNYVGKKNISFSVVRYGNVAGSRGSVIPLFQKISLKENFFPITDENMTRFWITLAEGVNFVLKSFERMKGGEIFIPVIPSFKITDLAKAINSKLKIKIVGLRPGEKINELMCSSDEADQVIRFKDYFIILPSIKNFAPSRNSYLTNSSKEKGKFVGKSFEFTSEKNNFLNISELKKRIKLIDD